MIEVQLSKTSQEKIIVTFDANVVNYFSVTNVRTSTSANGRIHVGHIKSIEITTNRKGKPALLLTTKFNVPFSNDEIDVEVLDKVKDLVAEVQRAMQTTVL
jgi:competence protein ComGF